MARQSTKTAEVRATEIVDAIRRQMRGAARAAKRSGAPLTEAGIDAAMRDAIIARLEPLWADVRAGLKGTKVASNSAEESLLAIVTKSGKK